MNARTLATGFAMLIGALACAAVAEAGAAAGPARATGAASPAGLSLTWSDCPGGVAATHGLTYACSGEGDQFSLVCSVVPEAGLTNVIGAELVVDIQSSAASLPDWWQFAGGGTGGCRAGTLNTDYDFSSSPACMDAWSTFAVGGIQGFGVGPPDHPFLNQARIKAVASVTSDHAAALSAGVSYGLLKLVISSAGTTGPAACSGCDIATCLVFNSALLRFVPPTADLVLSTPAVVGSNWATWQGTAANCMAVPVRHSTWGSIKSLYR